MLSRTFGKITGILLLCLAVGATASAQYPGGGGGMGGTGTGGTGTSRSYGSNGTAIGVGVGAAAAGAVTIALLVHHHHVVQARSEASLVGCTQSVLNGMSLKNETDNQTYALLSSGTKLQPGERVELKGNIANDASGTRTFHVRSMVTNYGACDSITAAKEKPAAPATATP